MMMSLVAMSIDAMLPALPAIGADLGVAHPNQPQLVVSALLLGLAAGQLIYGPISDSFGRKTSVYVGYAVFLTGCLVSILADDFNTMIIGRMLQGLGVAGPRVLTVALVRDQYQGRQMARIMSAVMAVFIIVPALAPALGQGVLMVAGWRYIFWLLGGLAVVSLLWFAVRQPETLPVERRIPFSLRQIASSLREIFTNKIALGYTVASGLIFSAFVGYLSSAQQVFQVAYDAGEYFAVWFGVLALALGAASLLNARLVVRHGMRRLSSLAAGGLTGISILFVSFAYASAEIPPFGAFIGYFVVAFFCLGLLFGNLNALAMEPLGHIAGIGASVVGAMSSFISIPTGVLIGQAFDGTPLPLLLGFALFSTVTFALIIWLSKVRQR